MAGMHKHRSRICSRLSPHLEMEGETNIKQNIMILFVRQNLIKNNMNHNRTIKHLTVIASSHFIIKPFEPSLQLLSWKIIRDCCDA